MKLSELAAMVAGALLLATAAEAALPSVVVLNRALPLKGVSLPELRKLDRARHARTGAVNLSVGGAASTRSLYYTSVELGNPSKRYTFDIDTGSSIPWVACKGCRGCSTKKLYNPDSSSTSSRISCSDHSCKLADQSGSGVCQTPSGICGYDLSYGDQTRAIGYYVSDIMHFDTITGNRTSANSSAPVVFGCTNSLSNFMAATDGILGSEEGGGILVLGKIVAPDLVYTPLVPSQSLYNLNLESIAVNGKKLPIDSSLFATSDSQGTVVDSGTTLAYTVEGAYAPFISAITAAISPSVRSLDTHLNFKRDQGDKCLSYSSIDLVFPTVTLYFNGGSAMAVNPSQYLLHQGANGNGTVWCIGWQSSQVWVRKLSSPFRAVSCFEIRRRYQAEESLCDLCLHFFSAVQNSGKRHKGRQAPYSCKTWIWVDLVRDYVEQLVNFQKRNLEILGKELAAARMELELKSEALICRELDMAEQGSIHHAEISELKSQLVTLQSQIKDLNSSALKFKKIRMFMYVGVCWLSSGSLPMTLAATAFAALMCDMIQKGDAWATYKLRSSLKKAGQVNRRQLDDPEGTTSDSEVSESECEGSRTSRSSARQAASVMENFCDRKKKAVREIGFGGLLHLPQINKVNLKFTLWVLSKFDVQTRSMHVGRDGRVFLCPEHIEMVLGVPSSGRPVCGLEPDNVQERTDFVRLAMGASQHCNNPLKAAQSVVTRVWKDDVPSDMVDEFKVAFVVWINGRFLAPPDIACKRPEASRPTERMGGGRGRAGGAAAPARTRGAKRGRAGHRGGTPAARTEDFLEREISRGQGKMEERRGGQSILSGPTVRDRISVSIGAKDG
ncbi:hypothetical protein ACQ4PT_017126 [Festuca glaucescens]